MDFTQDQLGQILLAADRRVLVADRSDVMISQRAGSWYSPAFLPAFRHADAQGYVRLVQMPGRQLDQWRLTDTGRLALTAHPH